MTRAALLHTFVATVGAGGLCFAVACSSEGEGRGSFTEDDAGPAAPSLDAGTDVGATEDAADPRPPFVPDDEAVVCAVSPCAVELAAGATHFCARMSDRTVRCWGSDGFGERGGDADAGAEHRPTTIQGLVGVLQIAAGAQLSCALTEDGSVFCWGDNRKGQLGLTGDVLTQDEDRHPSPARVALPGPATRVDVGRDAACATLTSGELVCWGSNAQQKLAPTTEGDPSSIPPRSVATAPIRAQRVGSSDFTSMALAEDGSLWSWGAVAGDEGIASGLLTSLSPRATPKRIEGLERVSSFAVSAWIQPDYEPPVEVPNPPPPPKPRAHGCAVVAGDVYCWGRSQRGALGTGLPDAELTPRLAPIASRTGWPQQVDVADEITCVRLTDGSIQCCGGDDKGRLGTGQSTVYSSNFVRASSFEAYAVEVATGDSAVCALVLDGSIACWGGNEHGELALPPDAFPHPAAATVAF